MTDEDIARQVAERRPATTATAVAHHTTVTIAYDELAALRAGAARLEAERDAARAALARLIADVEHIARHAHLASHDDGRGWRKSAREFWEQSWQPCDREPCPDLRRAVARARAATGQRGV